MINELLNFLELQKEKFLVLIEEYKVLFDILTFLQVSTLFIELTLLAFLVFVVINVKSFQKTIQNVKNLGALISLLIMSVKVTWNYPELIPILCLITIYFILKTDGFTDSEESLLTVIFGILLVVSSKLGNDPMFFAFIILFGYFKLIRKFNESHQYILIDQNQKATVIKTNILFAKQFRELALELGGRFAGEQFSALPKTQKKIAYVFRKVVQKSQDHPAALKLFGGSIMLSTYGVCNNYYKKQQVLDVEHVYQRSVEDRINLDRFDKNPNSVEGLMLKKDFLSALQARKDLVPLNIHEAVLKKGVEKSADPTFMELVNEGFEVLKAVG